MVRQYSDHPGVHDWKYELSNNLMDKLNIVDLCYHPVLLFHYSCQVIRLLSGEWIYTI